MGTSIRSPADPPPPSKCACSASGRRKTFAVVESSRASTCFWLILRVNFQLLMQISLLQVGLSETIKSLVDVPPQLRLGCSNSWNLGMSNAVRNSCAFIFSCWMQRLCCSYRVFQWLLLCSDFFWVWKSRGPFEGGNTGLRMSYTQ
ncbi:uncharacterized protein LOC108821370 isoform X2 [Raphanus sativus]|uniref:Uncharacterized protein LOC108821370 isoform X2 n=1 Tax=Raphanus sativus TaxID=3726 RepID=A0A9W3C8A1_RAPSA|nr:uncharacterized protein LOC108821370 isoform X2 [Raphanus sativus]